MNVWNEWNEKKTSENKFGSDCDLAGPFSVGFGEMCRFRCFENARLALIAHTHHLRYLVLSMVGKPGFNVV